MSKATEIRIAIEQCDEHTTEKLLPLVYDELRMLAAQKLAQEKPGQTLQATALVHEAWFRLMGGENDWNSRGHFFAAAAEAMRRILINRARDKQRLKRGGDRRRLDLEQMQIAVDSPPEHLLALDEALSELAREEPTCAELVKLQFFAGMTIPETAEALGIGRRTADRYWAYARSWLHEALSRRHHQEDR